MTPIKKPVRAISTPTPPQESVDYRLSLAPKDLGFNRSKFPAFRNNQLETAIKAADAKRKGFYIEAPTGAGKSLTGMSIPRIIDLDRQGSPATGFYMCSTKQLQDQIVEDFNVPVLKGRNNYPCLVVEHLFPEVTADLCAQIRKSTFHKEGGKCPYAAGCPYLVKKNEVKHSRMAVLNYSIFLYEANFIGEFSGRDFLIMDEVDTLEDQLMSFVELPISATMQKRYSLGMPMYKTKPESWKIWLTGVLARLGSAIHRLGEPDTMSPTQFKEVLRLTRLSSKIQDVIETIDSEWVMEIVDQTDKDNPTPGVVFRPVKVDKFANQYLWDHTSRFIGMSATIMGHAATAVDLGLKTWDVGFTSLPSPFPIENRQVIYDPVAEVSFKNKAKAYPELAKEINRILVEEHPQDKVLIHAVSYDLMSYFVSRVNSPTHKVFHHDKLSRVQTLKAFKDYQGPAVLISPSMDRGVDLPGDLCRAVIVAKLPFPSLGSPQVSRRLYGFPDGSAWYARRTIRTLIQATGRATRTIDDWSKTYVLDAQLEKIADNYPKMFPQWWVDALVGLKIKN